MELFILTEEGLNRLKDMLYSPDGVNAYITLRDRDKWNAEVNRKKYSIKHDLPEEHKLVNGLSDGKEESTRGKHIFSAFRDLSPLQASNKLLWTTLTHYEYSDFCCKKWFKDSDANSDRKKLEERILNRMFYRTGLGGVQRNAIARYYWGAKKTYELWKSPELGMTQYSFTDSYYLTDYMLDDSQIWQDTMQRAIGASDYLRFTYLVSSLKILTHLRETTQKNTIQGGHYSKWLSRLFTCWINGSSYRSLNVDESIDKFYEEALYLIPSTTAE